MNDSIIAEHVKEIAVIAVRKIILSTEELQGKTGS